MLSLTVLLKYCLKAMGTQVMRASSSRTCLEHTHTHTHLQIQQPERDLLEFSRRTLSLWLCPLSRQGSCVWKLDKQPKRIQSGWCGIKLTIFSFCLPKKGVDSSAMYFHGATYPKSFLNPRMPGLTISGVCGCVHGRSGTRREWHWLGSWPCLHFF